MCARGRGVIGAQQAQQAARLQASRKQAGMVSTQAMTIWPAMPQRTADRRRVAPTPMIAELMVWVVDTGMPESAGRLR